MTKRYMMRVAQLSAFLLSAIIGGTELVKAQLTAGYPENYDVTGGYCVRLFTRTGSVGCYGAQTGNKAELYSIKSADDIRAFESYDKDAIIALDLKLFTTSVIEKLEATSRVKGLLLMNRDPSATFSPASTTPQGKNSAEAKLNPFPLYEWNNEGRGMQDRLFGYPVLFVNSTFNDDLERQFEDNQANRPFKWTAIMNSYYGPKKMDSPGCLGMKNIQNAASPMCDPIGGHSAWAVKGGLSKPIVAAMAAMDTTAFSHNIVPGANSAASGIAALLAAADALKTINASALNRSIAFFLFEGEAYAFTGSQRFLKDLNTFRNTSTGCSNLVPGEQNKLTGKPMCVNPIRYSMEFSKLAVPQFDYILAVDQVALTENNEGNFFIQNNPTASKNISDLLSTIPLNRSVSGSFQGAVPPSPLTSFILSNRSIVGGVLTGYKSKFVSSNYRGELDTAWNSDTIGKAALIMAQSLLSLAGGQSSDIQSLTVNTTLIEETMKCLVVSNGCSFFYKVARPNTNTFNSYMKLTGRPVHTIEPSLYAGIYSSQNVQPVVTGGGKFVTRLKDAFNPDSNYVLFYPTLKQSFVRSFLASVTGTVDNSTSCTSSQDCQKSGDLTAECVYPGYCAKTDAYFHDAFSPALEPTSSFRVFDVTGDYPDDPIYTEPRWDTPTFSVTVYPDGGVVMGWSMLGAGAFVAIISYVMVISLRQSLAKNKVL